MLRKNTRVEFTDKGERKYGTVVKGGKKKVTVVLDGGKLQVSGPPSCFKASDKPLPQDPPSPMDGYQVKSYKDHPGRDTVGFSATIITPDKKKIEVANSGDGGPNFYRWDNEAIKLLHQNTKAWAKQFGSPYSFEETDLWVDWYQHERKFGILASKKFQDSKEQLAAYGIKD